MASLEEIEARLTAVEQELQAARQDAAAARVLAGGADRDVSALVARLDAQTKLLIALRETQVEQGPQLTDQGRPVAAQGGRLDSLDTRLQSLETEVRQGFGTLATGQTEITNLLQRLLPTPNND